MARVVEGFLLGTKYGLTFYRMEGKLYVRLKSSLSRKKVKYSPRFKRTMQSAGELGRASKVAARVYRELSKEQRGIVFVLYKKMTGVAKIAFKNGKSEEEAERDVREYLVAMGVVKREVKELLVEKESEKVEKKVAIKEIKEVVKVEKAKVVGMRKGMILRRDKKANVGRRAAGLSKAPVLFAAPRSNGGLKERNKKLLVTTGSRHTDRYCVSSRGSPWDPRIKGPGEKVSEGKTLVPG